MNREQQKMATGQKILMAAKQLFTQQGYEATSTRQIAHLADVGTGTVFAHFKDKHALTKALFYSELETQLSQAIFTIDQGALCFFSEQTLVLYQFYEKDLALAQAFLKNAFFEFGFFEAQLDEFTNKIAELLLFELPNKNAEQRLIIAQAWMGFYFLALVSGLADKGSTALDWHQHLMQQCKTLLTASNQ